MIVHNQGIKLTLPAAQTVAKVKKGAILSVDKHQKIFLNGTPVFESQLRQRIAELLREEPELQVTLNADSLSPYALIIRLMDEVRLGGCFDIVLETKKKQKRD